ncbi:transposable element Tcb2 transposase [Trichonephila clavipes]|nr:transposable element Tcb2 transposase [Trichonephila clavipes]
MDDNSRPHRANLVENSLFEEGIVRMEWPACSPDINPIEHVWNALGRRVAGRQPPPQSLQELERALLEEWDRMPQLVINSLIDSMPPRKGKNAVQAIKKLTDVFGEGVLTVRQNWFAKFRSGNFDVEDALRSERPVEADKEAIKALVDANR